MFGWLWRAPAAPLFRFRDTLIEAHWSVALPILTYAGVLGSTRFLGRYPELPGGAITAMTIVSVLMAPVSVVLHELGHTFQARREGLWAARITLWGLGGVSWNSGPRSPGAAFRVAAAGPMVSAFLAATFAALGWLGRRAGLPAGVVGVALLVAQFNAVTLAFNLVPMVPLDGGRILHSGLWRLRGARFAFVWAFRVALLIASGVIAFGVLAPFLNMVPQVAGFNPGLSIMFEGVIMLTMTLAYRSSAQLRPRRSGQVLVGDLVEAPAAGDAPSPGVTIARFLGDGTASRGYGTGASPVIDDGRTVGMISRGLAGLVPVDEREHTPVADMMLRKDDAVVLALDTPVADAFRILQAASKRGVIVDRGRVTAIILASDLADVLLRVKDVARGVVDVGPHSQLRRL